MKKADYRNPADKKDLEKGVSLRIYDKNNLAVFESSGKWLYPLFEVEDYIHAMAIDPQELFIHDRIAGRAAASLISRMGFRNCFIETISKPAAEVFERYGVSFKYNLLVERIDCRTEELITAEMDMEEVYMLLRQRAGRFQGIDLDILDLNVGYNGNLVLRGLNLKLRAGEQLVITGGSGAGKTTLINTLSGTVPRLSGEILLGGEHSGIFGKIPSPIGYLNQSIQSTDFPIATEDVIALGLPVPPDSSTDLSYEIEIAMRLTGCFHLAGQDVNSLSGGEKQKVSLARCLMRKAGLILMDEPTSFLDHESKEEFRYVLNNVVRSQMPTIVLASRDHDWIDKLGWKVLTLKDGRL